MATFNKTSTSRLYETLGETETLGDTRRHSETLAETRRLRRGQTRRQMEQPGLSSPLRGTACADVNGILYTGDGFLHSTALPGDTTQGGTPPTLSTPRKGHSVDSPAASCWREYRAIRRGKRSDVEISKNRQIRRNCENAKHRPILFGANPAGCQGSPRCDGH